MINLLFCILLLLPKDTCKESYIRKIMENHDGVDFFLVVKAKDQDKKIKTIVLSCFELSENLKKQSCKINKKILSKIYDDKFVLAVNDSSKWFTEVNYFTEVDEAKMKGDDYFTQKYFNKNGYLKEDVVFEQVGHIIQVLFDWNILISESEGNIYIDRKRFCNDNLSKLIPRSS